MLQFKDWFLKEDAQMVQSIGSNPQGTFVKIDNKILGPIEKVIQTSYGPNIIYVKPQNAQPILANLSNISQDPKQQNLKQQLLSQFKPAAQQKQAPFTPHFQNILAWPTSHLPKPPPYWKPEYMELTSDRAQKVVANGLLQKGMDAAQAGKIGQAVAQYVWDYSAYPYNVYKRVLDKIGERNQDVDLQKAIQYAKNAGEKAAPIHQKLMARNYQ